jgi:hypothetical protein
MYGEDKTTDGETRLLGGSLGAMPVRSEYMELAFACSNS